MNALGAQRAGQSTESRMYSSQHSQLQCPNAGAGETKRYTVLNLIGKGSYGVVCAAKDNLTGELVAIKKIQNVFDNVADAIRILREITLLRLLKHPDMVDIKHIMLPSDPNTYKDLYVVFELMESDLHMVIGANRDLTPDHHKVFLFQLLRGINYMHISGVLHRDLKPKNILVNSNCKLKVCDLGLARPYTAGQKPLSPVMWTEYVATRWYRAPELCGQFYGKYTGAVDIWSVGCIFAEVLLGKPLFPGRDLVSQLQLITDLLGKPTPHVINGITNPRARAFLINMQHKDPRPFAHKFPGIDPLALDLLQRMLAFDPAQRPSAAEALAHPYFAGMPSALQQDAKPVAPNFEFEKWQLSESDVRHLIYREALHYHPEVRGVYEQQLVRSRNPYPLMSTPADSVSLQFMLQQSDSGESCSYGDAASVETCTSDAVNRFQQQQQVQRMAAAQAQHLQAQQAAAQAQHHSHHLSHKGLNSPGIAAAVAQTLTDAIGTAATINYGGSQASCMTSAGGCGSGSARQHQALWEQQQQQQAAHAAPRGLPAGSSASGYTHHHLPASHVYGQPDPRMAAQQPIPVVQAMQQQQQGLHQAYGAGGVGSVGSSQGGGRCMTLGEQRGAVTPSYQAGGPGGGYAFPMAAGCDATLQI